MYNCSVFHFCSLKNYLCQSNIWDLSISLITLLIYLYIYLYMLQYWCLILLVQNRTFSCKSQLLKFIISLSNIYTTFIQHIIYFWSEKASIMILVGFFLFYSEPFWHKTINMVILSNQGEEDLSLFSWLKWLSHMEKKNYWQGRANRILVMGSFAKILVLKIVPVIHVNNQFKPKKSALTRVLKRRHLADRLLLRKTMG